MIETWGFYFFNSGRAPGAAGEPSPEELQLAFDRYLQLWIACEGYGFDGLAFAEHHFNQGCLSPSTHLLVPAVARATRRLRFTTLGSVLPLTDARRFVEEIGMLDYLTGGRYESGIAPGAGDRDAVMTGMR